jgi:hypothetical protein
VVGLPADPSRWTLALGRIVGSAAAGEVVNLRPILPGEYVFAALPTLDFFTLIREPHRAEGLATIGTRLRLAEGDDRTIELQLVNLPPAR